MFAIEVKVEEQRKADGETSAHGVDGMAWRSTLIHPILATLIEWK